MKHTILFVAANPRGTDSLALDEECRAIQHELRLTADRDDFDFRSEWAVGIDDLMRSLNALSPSVLHFSGHGARGSAHNSGAPGGPHRDVDAPRSGGILLQGRDGAQYVDHRALAAMIASAPPVPRLVVLNACYSATAADSLRQVVDCVVGVEAAIGDTAARDFAVRFYGALGYRRHSIGTAVEQARAAMNAKQLPGDIVTCCPRNGMNADELYLSETRATPDRVVGSMRAPVFDEPSPNGEPLHRPPLLDIRPSAARTAAQPTGSGTWPAGAGSYDLFLVHAPAHKASASALYDLLQPVVRVFLACRSLSTHERREQAVSAAQRSSYATVLLIWPRTELTWYLSDEIITAIALHRAAPNAHQLLAVRFGAGAGLPRCFREVETLAAPAGDLTGVAERLRELVAALSPAAAAPRTLLLPALDRRAGCDPFRVHERLCQLTDAMFEQIAAQAGIDRGSFASRAAPLAERALDIALLVALDPVLCRRLSTELDRRAPWTR
ncbi:MAG TPA: CHAT domain-containing protein [Kofleriaceae bacterium]|nr:CHAT domain-containing protein [Kofleriaceae bacterium]